MNPLSPANGVVPGPPLTSEPPPAFVRRDLCDLATLLALPSLWIDRAPDEIARDLAGVLLRLLRLDLAYIRFVHPDGQTADEHTSPDTAATAQVVNDLLAAITARGIPLAGGGVWEVGTQRVTLARPTLPGEDGLVLAAATRPEFPDEMDRFVLSVASAQAAMARHTARLLATERTARLAAETALRERTASLASLAPHLLIAQEALAALEADLPAHTLNSMTSAQLTSVAGADQGYPRVPLSRREADVLGLLAQGLGNKEIAIALSLSDRTIERHITGLYARIGVQRRTEAMLFAIRHGLATPDRHDP